MKRAKFAHGTPPLPIAQRPKPIKTSSQPTQHHITGSPTAMALVDAVAALFSLIMAVSAPLFDSQVVLPLSLYPAPLVDVFRWFTAEFDNYVVAERPPFLRGLVWIDLAFLWPVSVANLYGILARRRWSATTSLMASVHMLTYLAAMFGEMLESGRATPKLLGLYLLFLVFAVASVARGLCSWSTQATPAAGPSSPALAAGKKRVYIPG